MPPIDRKWFVVFLATWIVGTSMGMVFRLANGMGWPESPGYYIAMVFCGWAIPWSGAAWMRMVDDYFERKVERLRNPERYR